MLVENTKAKEIIIAKELGKMAPKLREKEYPEFDLEI
jgi:hypothetical protein